MQTNQPADFDFKIAKSQAHRAFTLAEVLLTLGIIGIIATLTIPNLIQSYQKQEAVTKLEKVYTVISQAHKNAELEIGSSTNWDYPTGATPAEYRAWWDTYFIPYANLSVIKTCTGSTTSQCWPAGTYLDGTPCGNDYDSYYLVLKDGTILRLWTVNNIAGYLTVDLNGIKSPNVMGKDRFIIMLSYKDGKVKFYGYNTQRTTLLSDDSSTCNKQKDKPYKGSYCGALIQIDGWQIKDDYPW